MKQIDVLYNLSKDGVEPTQGYELDYAYDVYASKGVLVPPLTFKSVRIHTGLRTAFDPELVGLMANLRSGIAANTPLILSNGTGIIEGTYRGEIQILVRNSFIDNSLVPFVLTLKGEQVPISELPKEVLEEARRFYEEETNLLGYEGIDKTVQQIAYQTVVPRGTIYIQKHERVAQLSLSDKFSINWIETDKLPESVRQEGGLGSSGVKNGK
jgi:dUTPase